MGIRRIEVVEIERETASTVWICGKMFKKNRWGYAFFDTFEEAKAHLESQCQKRLESIKMVIENNKKSLIAVTTILEQVQNLSRESL